jgi:hypothetical protein
MKTLAKVKVLVLVGMGALVSGCGPDERTRNMDEGPPPEAFQLRMLGVDQGNLSAALLSVSSVTATADGLSLEVVPAYDTVDLTANRQAWLLGRVLVPKGVESVDLTVRFDDAGGFESRLGNGMVDSRRAVVSWRAPVAWLRTNGHAVIHLDLQRSLVVTGPEARRLIPSAAIHY